MDRPDAVEIFSPDSNNSTVPGQLAKEFDSRLLARMVFYACSMVGALRRDMVMAEKTCAACDCKLDESAINLTLDKRTIEVRCEECAEKLRESQSEKTE
jgi:hypothetical protein